MINVSMEVTILIDKLSWRPAYPAYRQAGGRQAAGRFAPLR